MTAEPRAARMPDDALVLLIGPSGSGKSTWAARHFPAAAVLSSDHFRQLVAGDETDQSATADAFKVLQTVARARLRRGLLTVVDATNLTLRARQSLRRLASAAGRPVVAVAFDIPVERCLAQNGTRQGRQVPEEVIRRHGREMLETMRRLPGEGYVQLMVLGEADISAA